MKKFSEFFELNKSQTELDFVDITPGSDVPFVDRAKNPLINDAA
ncbi:hypothetical protein LDG_6479 [Legionella drancourtii LLAP12]|uniref:Uncharacterized protein n=1 Tax=Legionella drancourtii LLAP12 TaxID=658187 RepID=G9EML1_9GAMM|nr:hypothetical protein LDG_6479 [Legionella drancourtii LLAP12]